VTARSSGLGVGSPEGWFVSQNDRGGPQRQCRPENLPRLERGDVEATHRDLFTAKRLVARIQVENGEALLEAAAQFLVTGEGPPVAS